jgi:hypothetical protein
MMQKFFRDKQGNVAVWQRPNLPLTVWFVARVAQWPLSGRVEHYVGLVGTAALLLWAGLEIADGASYFRRVLGLVVFVLTIASIAQK